MKGRVYLNGSTDRLRLEVGAEVSDGQGLGKEAQDRGAGSCWGAGPVREESAVMMRVQRGGRWWRRPCRVLPGVAVLVGKNRDPLKLAQASVSSNCTQKSRRGA